MATLDSKVIPFPARSTNPQPPQHLTTAHAQLLKAAKAAYSALLLAVPHGEKNTVVKTLGDAIRAADASQQPPLPPVNNQPKPSAPQKLSSAIAAQLLRELHSERCVCGNDKEPRRPFCRRCYFGLPDALRASMWLSSVDDNYHLLDRIVAARVHLRSLGMLSHGGAA